MGISNFIASSIDALDTGRNDVALALACSAVDATSSRLTGYKNNSAKRFKDFISENMEIVTLFGFPGICCGTIEIKCINVKDIKTNSKGYAPISEIIYKTIRCGLTHECKIDERIEFTEQTKIADFHGKFKLPKQIILGLIMAVILSPKNLDCRVSAAYAILLNDKQIRINDLWGIGKMEFYKKYQLL